MKNKNRLRSSTDLALRQSWAPEALLKCGELLESVMSGCRFQKQSENWKLLQICGVQLQSSGCKAPSGSWQPQPALELVSDLHQVGEKSIKGTELSGARHCGKKQLRAPHPSRDASNRWWCCSRSLSATARGSLLDCSSSCKADILLHVKVQTSLGVFTPRHSLRYARKSCRASHPPAASLSNARARVGAPVLKGCSDKLQLGE